MTSRPEPKVQPMPLDRAILWNPPAAAGTTEPGKASNRSPYPIFFQQEAVVALQDHIKSSPTQAVFGFLIGDIYRDPETGVLYTVIDKTLKLSQAIYGDKTEVVVSRLWDRMQEQLKKASASLLGWYHSHPGQGGFLTAHDVETHEKFFTEPFHVAVLVAAEAGGVTGRFFRTSQSNDWHKTPVAFYELVQPESIKSDGKKKSFITWRNYKAHGPTLTGPKPKPAAPPPKAEELEEPEEVEAEAPPPPGEKGFRIMRGSADDIPVVRTSADDEPAPLRELLPEPPPPPLPEPEPPPEPPPPPPKPAKTKKSRTRAAAPPPPPPEPPPEAPPAPPEPAPSVAPPEPAPAAATLAPVAPPAPEPPPPPTRQRRSDELPWTVTPESVASVPPPVIEPPRSSAPSLAPMRIDEPAPPVPSTPPRTSVPRPARRSLPRRIGVRWSGWRDWMRQAALALLLVGIGGGAYWYFEMRNPRVPPPWAGLVNRAKKLVSRPPAPPSRARRQVPPPAATSPVRVVPPTAAARPAPQPIQASPQPAPAALPDPPSPFARYDRLRDSLARAVRNYRDRAALFASARTDCNGLANALVAMENVYFAYNVERRARMNNFDEQRAIQDQALYASVDSAESNFEQSGCRRP